MIGLTVLHPISQDSNGNTWQQQFTAFSLIEMYGPAASDEWIAFWGLAVWSNMSPLLQNILSAHCFRACFKLVLWFLISADHVSLVRLHCTMFEAL